MAYQGQEITQRAPVGSLGVRGRETVDYEGMENGVCRERHFTGHNGRFRHRFRVIGPVFSLADAKMDYRWLF